MPERRIPINKDVIIWARNTARLTQKEAAELLGVPLETLAAWEGGELPTAGHFNKMVTVYRRSPAVLLMPEVPTEAPPPRDFRFAEAITRELPRDVLFTVRSVRFLVDSLADIIEADPSLKPSIPFPGQEAVKGSPGQWAAIVRNKLRVDTTMQRGWPRQDALKHWRLRIQEFLGPLVFLEKLSTDQCLGFSLADHEDLPVIVVNKDDPIMERQIFTLAHEYGHLLIKAAGVCLKFDDRSDVERWCNEFAGNLLVPVEALKDLFPGFTPGTLANWTIKDVQWAATELKVSKEVIALRLERLGSAQGLYGAVRALRQGSHGGGEQTGGFAPPAVKRLNQVGMQAVRIVMRAYEKRLITTMEVGEILQLRPKWYGVLTQNMERQLNTYLR